MAQSVPFTPSTFCLTYILASHDVFASFLYKILKKLVYIHIVWKSAKYAHTKKKRSHMTVCCIARKQYCGINPHITHKSFMLGHAKITFPASRVLNQKARLLKNKTNLNYRMACRTMHSNVYIYIKYIYYIHICLSICVIYIYRYIC